MRSSTCFCFLTEPLIPDCFWSGRCQTSETPLFFAFFQAPRSRTIKIKATGFFVFQSENGMECGNKTKPHSPKVKRRWVLVADACYATLAVRRRFGIVSRLQRWASMLPQAHAYRWSVHLCGRRVLAIWYKWVRGMGGRRARQDELQEKQASSHHNTLFNLASWCLSDQDKNTWKTETDRVKFRVLNFETWSLNTMLT